MSSQLIGLLLILIILIVFLVVNNSYVEKFYESDEDIIARCGKDPYDYLKKNIPTQYYWLPTTISYPVNQNYNPTDAVVGYEWSKCTGGKLTWDKDISSIDKYIPVWYGDFNTPPIRLITNDKINRQLIAKNINSDYIENRSDGKIIIVKPGNYSIIANEFNQRDLSPIEWTVIIVRNNEQMNIAIPATVIAPGEIKFKEVLNTGDEIIIIYKGPSNELIVLSNPTDYQFKIMYLGDT